MRGDKVPGSGPVNARLMVVGEAPGDYEDALSEVLVGPTGQDTDRFLKTAGSSLNECYKTNVLKWRPPHNDVKRFEETGHTIEECEQELWEEIRLVKPNCILALGGYALQAITGFSKIGNYRGSIILTRNGMPKVVSTYHPASLFPKAGQAEATIPWSARAYMHLDFKRAVEESLTPIYDPPRRTIEICKTATQLQRYLNQYDNVRLTAADVESHNAIIYCIGIARSINHAIVVPTMDIHTWKGVGRQEYLMIWNILCNLLTDPRIQLIGHNFKYDHTAINSQMRFGIPLQIHADTKMMSHTCYPELPSELQFLTSIYTREPYYKDELKEFNPKKDRIEQVFTYNGKDCIVTLESYYSLLKELNELGLTDFYFNFVNKLHPLYMEIDSHGILVDRELRAKVTAEYEKMHEEISAELTGINDGEPVNVFSPPQVHTFLKSLGFPIRKSADEETLVALYGNHTKNDKQRRGISLVIQDRRIRKSIGTYFKAEPDFDGRHRTIYRMYGTETGRTSTGKLVLPVRPAAKPGFGLAFQTITKHGKLGPAVRSFMIADPGCVFCQVDSSQAEARVVALLARDDELLRLFDETDIHKLTATWIFSKEMEDITEDERFIGKTGRHAMSYGMAKRRLMMDTNAAAFKFDIDIKLSEKEAERILKIIHYKTPKIRGIFHADVVRALEENDNARVLVNAFGRKRQFFERWGDSLFREAFAQIPQSSVGDNTKRAMLLFKEEMPHIPIVKEDHDSFTAMPRLDQLKDCYQLQVKCMEQPIDFTRCSLPRGLLTIPADIEIGRNLRDFKKLKKYTSLDALLGELF